MTVVNKPTAELKPYDKNAKKHDTQQRKMRMCLMCFVGAAQRLLRANN